MQIKKNLNSGAIDRQVDAPKNAVILKKYVHGLNISMNKRPTSLIFLLKTGADCWEADGNGAKLRDLFLILMTPKFGSGVCD